MNIQLYGTFDNYNTEYTEHLHIDLAKDAYRSTNYKDKFPQMTLWLERKEKILRHDQFIDWQLCSQPPPPIITNLHPGIIYERKLLMAKHPTYKSVKFSTIEAKYGAPFFPDALSRYMIQLIDPTLTRAQIEHDLNTFNIPFNSIPVFQNIKFTISDPCFGLLTVSVRRLAIIIPTPYGNEGPTESVVESIHVHPSKTRFEAFSSGGAGLACSIADWVQTELGGHARWVMAAWDRGRPPRGKRGYPGEGGDE
ncbi:hypothetical protein B0H17DRAFT_1124475 [Mycena rosella]|uniref:Uncharacterized protein n=1 Tax=Mycena rosella TaxID=1033263 RepID=A0AAD7GZI0_MYCRO|nr:hypothetical protein B0H17DRAFT_1124475 [Mycena rosella]